MGRYTARQVSSAPRNGFDWLVLDTETGMVAQLNGVWLEYVTEIEAEQLVAELNRIDFEAQDSTLQ
jgi:hypothetical protein